MDRPNGHRPMPQPSRPVPAPFAPLVSAPYDPSSAPFASYASPSPPFTQSAYQSPDTQPIPLEDDDEDDRNDTVRPRVRESIVFQQSVNRGSMSSTSSLVSAGGRVSVGRPMGIPPETESVPTVLLGRTEMGRASLGA
jgi:hypothetical protein